MTDEQIAAAASEEELRAMWSGASQVQPQQIMARAGVNIETGDTSTAVSTRRQEVHAAPVPRL